MDRIAEKEAAKGGGRLGGSKKHNREVVYSKGPFLEKKNKG